MRCTKCNEQMYDGPFGAVIMIAESVLGLMMFVGMLSFLFLALPILTSDKPTLTITTNDPVLLAEIQQSVENHSNREEKEGFHMIATTNSIWRKPEEDLND